MKLSVIYNKLKSEISKRPKIKKFTISAEYSERHKHILECTCFYTEDNNNFTVRIYENNDELNIENILLNIDAKLNTLNGNQFNSIEI